MKTLQDNLTAPLHIFLIATLLLITNLFYSNQLKAQCHIDDWRALKALYESTNGAGWLNDTGWIVVTGLMPTANCNLQNLHGVEVDVISGRVTMVNLPNNNLIGSIPPEIGDLIYLEQLQMSSNNLVGSIPAEIGNLTYLKNLYLNNDGAVGNNNLTGNIPIEIGNLLNLEDLWLCYNNLSGSIPASIGNLSKLKRIMAQWNQFSGEIPASLGNLTDLTHLYLYRNQLMGNIPDGICNLTNLIELKLTHNELAGNIPACLGHPTNGNLSSLQHLDFTSNKLSGSIPENIGNLISLNYLVFSSNKLTGNIPASIGSLVNLESFGIGSNYLDGEIPDSIGNLSSLVNLWLSNNSLSGNIPASIGNLQQLTAVYLHNNNLSGFIPAFSNPSLNLQVPENYFSCSQIQDGINQNSIAYFDYEPQYITPSNYDDEKSHVIDTLEIGIASKTLSPAFVDASGYTYQWKQNDIVLNGETNAIVNLQNIQPGDAGKYTLHIQDPNCTLGVEFISDPIFVLVEGYDLYGQVVEYNQVMVEFASPERTVFYENEFLNGKGWVKKRCNCNRELYLWEFQSTEDAIDALVAIDAKHHTIKKKPDVDGGFNNQIEIGDADMGTEAYTVLRNTVNTNYPDEVTIFLLDTGLDETNTTASPYLMDSAPIDGCYNVNSAAGYNYTNDSIDVDYTDEVWHGTFGFHAISNELDQNNNVDIVPLKIFDDDGRGSLFDLTCAIYHAIDHEANIINISAGYQGQHSGILENAINYARENDVFICTAAGNDTLNIDATPQYPAYFASQYHYMYDDSGISIVDSIKYENVVSIASIDHDNNFSGFSNYGQASVTISAYGENVHSFGLEGSDVIASGSSMATYFVSRELALEIATNKNRSHKQIWNDFTNNCLIDNPSTNGKTITGKQLNVPIEPIVYGCTDEESCNYNELATIEDGTCQPCNTGPTCNSNARLANPVRIVIEGAFAKFAQRSFTNNFIKAEKAYIKHQKEIHRILSSADKKYVKVNANFQSIKDIALSLLYQTFINTKNETIVNTDHLQKLDDFFASLHSATNNQDLKKEIDDIRRYLHVMKDKELHQALIDFDKAGLEDVNETMEDNLLLLQESFTVQLMNALGRDAYVIYQSSISGIVNIQLFDVDGRKLQQSFSQTIEKGQYQHTLFKQNLPKGMYYAQIYFKSIEGKVFSKVLKVSMVQ